MNRNASFYRRSLVLCGAGLTGLFGCGGGKPATACLTDSECFNGQFCLNHVCTPVNNDGSRLCEFDTNCRSGETCSGGVCGHNGNDGGPVSCTSEADCPRPLHCKLMQRRCVECLLDEHCLNADEVCFADGTCAPPSGDEDCTPAACALTGKVCDTGILRCRDCTGNIECTGGLVCVGGTCGPCTGPGQCTAPNTCDTGLHSCVTPGGGLPLGTDCTDSRQCSSSLCLRPDPGTPALQFCSQPCIGSGKGGGADCPVGFACWLGIFQTPYDGLRFCVPAELLTNGSGYPYDLLPGQTCTTGVTPNRCQTDMCVGPGCARYCSRDADCTASEGCWAADTGPYQFNVPTGYHYCAATEAVLGDTGDECSNNSECNSGVCLGLCADPFYPLPENVVGYCNMQVDCASGTKCWGTCASHCRTTSDCPGHICTNWALFTNPTIEYPHPWNGDLWTPVCMNYDYPDPPNQGEGSACSTPGDCLGEYCEQAICTRPCVIDADCAGSPAGLHCVLRKVILDANTLLYLMGMCGTRCYDDGDCIGNIAGTSCLTEPGLTAACGTPGL